MKKDLQYYAQKFKTIKVDLSGAEKSEKRC